MGRNPGQAEPSGGDNARSVLAEALGTFSLVTVGCGAIVVEERTGELTHLGVALAFGLVVMVVVAAIGHISGAHINPAVTFGFAVAGHFPWRRVPEYIGAQLVGAISGALVLCLILGGITNLGATMPSIEGFRALCVEAILTAALMWVITAVATDAKAEGQLAAIMIGATVGLNALWAGPLTGASMNPARSFGPALVTGIWRAHWLYWLGPLVGAVVGGGLYQLIREPTMGAQHHLGESNESNLTTQREILVSDRREN